ncbi:MAG: transporter substrate-binding domain-containing protein [Pseudomonadota bacterium]|nr:transporter substrate-binding domain-containing protein [Pseudomonadota bacterium]
MNKFLLALCALLAAASLAGCGSRAKISTVSELEGKEFAVPTGTVADQLVLSKYPTVKIKYYNTVLDAALAVKAHKADAAGYDEPILRNIAAKNPGLKVLPEPITVDDYGFAVRLPDTELKAAIDAVVADLKTNGEYAAMMKRWLPESGSPAPMPKIEEGTGAALRFGTAAVTEPFSFVDGSREVVGLDVELARLVAKRLNRKIEVVNMDFGAMIPALISGKVDMIGACITITPERATKVLFSSPYYKGGISALVAE